MNDEQANTNYRGIRAWGGDNENQGKDGHDAGVEYLIIGF